MDIYRGPEVYHFDPSVEIQKLYDFIYVTQFVEDEGFLVTITRQPPTLLEGRFVPVYVDPINGQLLEGVLTPLPSEGQIKKLVTRIYRDFFRQGESFLLILVLDTQRNVYASRMRIMNDGTLEMIQKNQPILTDVVKMEGLTFLTDDGRLFFTTVIENNFILNAIPSIPKVDGTPPEPGENRVKDFALKGSGSVYAVLDNGDLYIIIDQREVLNAAFDPTVVERSLTIGYFAIAKTNFRDVQKVRSSGAVGVILQRDQMFLIDAIGNQIYTDIADVEEASGILVFLNREGQVGFFTNDHMTGIGEWGGGFSFEPERFVSVKSARS